MDEKDIFRLFTGAEPFHIESRDSCHGDADFRRTLIGTFRAGALPEGLGEKLVVKLAANGFTDEERLELWERLINEYRALGYDCPRIMRSLDGVFPKIDHEGHRCVCWAEEFSKHRCADTFAGIQDEDGRYRYLDDALLMNARVAAKRFDFSPLPSGYTLFGIFDKNCAEPEVMEAAHGWLKTAEALPEPHRERAMKLWDRWLALYEHIRDQYERLPSSIFQADINSSNVLLDEGGGFSGVIDFNLAGRDTLLNLLLREVPYAYGWPEDDNKELEPVEKARTDNDLAARRIRYALSVVGREYRFTDAERELALPLFRCVRALWWPDCDCLEEAKTDSEIAAALDEVERVLTEDFDFASAME